MLMLTEVICNSILCLLPVFLLLMPPHLKDMLVFFAAFLVIGPILMKLTPKAEKPSLPELVSGAAISVLLTVVFFLKWHTSQRVAAFAALLHLNQTVVIALASLVLGVWSVFGTAFLLKLAGRLCGKAIHLLEQPFFSRRERAIAAAAITAVIYVLQSRLILYPSVDNFILSQVLNGLFDGQNYCMFVSATLASIVKLIRMILPHADGVALYMECTVLLGIWSILYTVSLCSSKRSSILAPTLILAAITLNMNLLHANFTIYTAFVTMAGFLTSYPYITGRASKLLCVSAVVLVFSGILFRMEVSLLFLPYVILMSLGAGLSNYQKPGFRQTATRVGTHLAVICLLLAGVMVHNAVVQNRPEIAAGLEFSNVRSDIVDYPNRSDREQMLEELAELDVSENDYNVIRGMILMDTDRADQKYLQDIAEISGMGDEILQSGYVRIRNYVTGVKHQQDIILQIILLVIAFGMVLFSEVSPFSKLQLVLGYLGTLIILLYFILTGRAPSHVVISLMMALWLSVIHLFSMEKAVLSAKLRTFGLILCGVSIVLLVNADAFLVGENGFSLGKPLSAMDSPVTDVVNYDSHEDTVYIWGVYDFDSRIMHSRFPDTMTTPEFLEKNLMDGEWTYRQVYYGNFLRRIALENPMRALIEREHTYYVANEERCNLVLAYLQEHFDETITREQVSSCDIIPVWRFTYGSEIE